MKRIVVYMLLFIMSMSISVNAAIYQCKACPAGSISTGINLSSCKKCPAGTYSEIGGTSCLECPDGYYCPGGVDKIPCPVGKYCQRRVEYANSSCYKFFYFWAHFKECLDSATYHGATAPKDCPSGQYQPYKGTSSCLSCNTTVEKCDFSYKHCWSTRDCDSYRLCVGLCVGLAVLCKCSKCTECENKTRDGHKFVYRSVDSSKTSCNSTSESECYDGAFSGK